MQSENCDTRNLFEHRNTEKFNLKNPEHREAVFISYKRKPDRGMAQKCVAILRAI